MCMKQLLKILLIHSLNTSIHLCKAINEEIVEVCNLESRADFTRKVELNFFLLMLDCLAR